MQKLPNKSGVNQLNRMGYTTMISDVDSKAICNTICNLGDGVI